LLTFVALVSVTALSSYAQSPALLTHHVREAASNGQAQPVGHLSSMQSLRLVVALPLRNQSELESLLPNLYDPSHPSFHHFLTVDEFTRSFGPRQQDYSAVIHWAKANGLQVVGTSRNRVNVDVVGSVSRIEQALHIKLGLYQHPTENRIFYSPDREPRPDLTVQLWHISGLDNYSIPRPSLKHRSDKPEGVPPATTGSCPSQSFCGSDMRAAYYEGTSEFRVTNKHRCENQFQKTIAAIWRTRRKTQHTREAWHSKNFKEKNRREKNTFCFVSLRSADPLRSVFTRPELQRHAEKNRPGVRTI